MPMTGQMDSKSQSIANRRYRRSTTDKPRGSWLVARHMAVAVAGLLVASSASAFALAADPARPILRVVAEANETPRLAQAQPAPPSTTTRPSGPTTTTRLTAAPTTSSLPTTTSTRQVGATPTPTPAPGPATPPRASTHSFVGPRGPGTVSFPDQPGRTSWDGISNGITFHLTVDPAMPRVGDPVRFHVDAFAGEMACCGLYLQYGDGGHSSTGTETTPEQCAAAVPRRTSADYTHIYNQPGEWEFSFAVSTGHCLDDITYGAIYGYVDVAPGLSRSQGPELPKTTIHEARDPSQPVAPGTLQVWAKGTDEDGYITRIVIDFGDGSPAVIRPGESNACRPTPSAWPAASTGFTVAPFPTHHYNAPGTYTVTATVVSAGCDGAEEQSVTVSMPYSW